MDTCNYVILHEREGMRSAIHKITVAAFGSQQEAERMRRLRYSGRYVPELSLVAHCDANPVGHILFNWLPLKVNRGLLSLMPMAVLPEYQNQGVASMLIQEGIKRAKIFGFAGIVVLGVEEEFYRKFGFSSVAELGLNPPEDLPPDKTLMAMEFEKGALAACQGKLFDYPEELGL